MLSILDILEDTTVDGPGFRTAIYAAGCPNGCPGCHNPESWDINRGRWMSTDEILQKVLADNFADVTFSGGEIAVTRPQSASTATYSMTANFAPVAANDADYGINAEGTYFVPNVSIPSFNAKATPVGTAKPTFLSIFGNDPDLTALPSIPTSGLQERVEVFTVESGVMIRSDRDIRISIFEVSGRLLQTPQLREGMNYITLSAGQYVINGRVMIVK